MIPSATPNPTPDASPHKHAVRQLDPLGRLFTSTISGSALTISSQTPTPNVNPKKLAANPLLGSSAA